MGSQTLRAVEKNDGIHIHEAGESVPLVISLRDLMIYDADGKAVPQT